MDILIALLIGILFGTGIFCLLRRSLTRLVIGVILISQAVNMMVFVSAGLTRAAPPLIESGKKVLEGVYADPLPQALVLTAIVIGFGLVTFLLALVHRVFETTGTDDVDSLRKTDS